MSKDDLVRVLDNIRDLPTLPTSYFKISKLLQDVNTPAREVSRILESDQAIASKVLRLVNSSFFGFSRRVTQVNQAVMLLGYSTIRNAVLSISVLESFPAKSSLPFDRREFWRHTIGTAIVARQLARLLKIGQEEEAFAGGILHDLGKLVLDQCLPEQFRLILAYVQEKNVSMLEAERQILGCTHAEIGEYLLERWRLPHSLVEAVALHHTPANIRSNPRLVSVVHLGDHLCRRLQIGYGGDPLVPPIHPFVFGELGFTENDLENMVPQLQEDLQNSDDLLSLVKY
jgi:putative nucleotidyltransferase with HDIG domain